MNRLETIKKRFLKDNVAIRLGGLACNLARLKSFAQMSLNNKAIKDLIEESKFFIEWTAPVVSLNIQEELVSLQIQLALWDYVKEKREIINSSEKWSKKILKLSGMLNGGKGVI